jgi:membrane protease YdiL (CAAX protease family)
MLSPKPWRAEAVIQLIAGVLVCLCLGAAAVGVLRQAGVTAFKSPDSFAGVLVATLSFQGAAWVLIFIFLKLHDLDWRDALGLRNKNLIRSLLLAMVVLVVMLPVVLSLQQLSAMALDKIGWKPEDQHAVDLLLNAKSFWMHWYLAFFAVVLAPVAEEFIFRGVLFPFIKQIHSLALVQFIRQCGLPAFARCAAKRRFWRILAWVGVSLLFALIHVNAPTFVPLFVLALALTWLYEKTDCLLASIMVHSLFNAANLVVLFLQNQ